MNAIVLTTPRLLLRHLCVNDMEAVAALYADPVGMASKGGPRPPSDAQHNVLEAIAEYKSIGYGFYATLYRENNGLIGLCGLLAQMVDGQAEIEIAYMFAKEYWGRGLATEAAQALKLYGFTQVQAKRLIALIAPANIASQRVALKIGMHYERDWVDWKGRAKHIYSITTNGYTKEP
ncbi:MAG: GNAT family N-acetyltransferase [Caldilineaceae bacterium]